ncbi:site-specific integrase [Billgrantia gudaonensis]|nr:site-specific integrase [Halomonas gudaonensis]
MDRVKATMRVKRYSPRTEKTYCYWIRYFIRFHGVRHPASMGGPEVRAFLEHLAIQRHVAAATQNQALNAIVFLYRHVLESTCWAKALPAYAARWAEARGHSGTLPPLPGHAAMTRCHPCGSPCVRLGHSRLCPKTGCARPYGVKNRLVRESDQSTHLQRVNSVFSPIFSLSGLRSPTFQTTPSHLQRPLPYRNQPLRRGQRPRRHE